MPKTVAKQPSMFEGLIDPNRLYHYKEIAELVGVKETQAFDWIYRVHRLPFVQLPRGRRVRGADLIAFLEEGYVEKDGK